MERKGVLGEGRRLVEGSTVAMRIKHSTLQGLLQYKPLQKSEVIGIWFMMSVTGEDK